ncbi:MAG TPA: GIY-YIG nuclease family protein [Bacteroidales bacterium]|nr:GIY-YIG nuclease family protein [Bacteroidales bacterium]HMM12794.1 GIY-YIG nuclease family protein [Bacteroidales bacterium]
MIYVYIIYSSACDEYYKGVTEHPDQRLAEHNADKSRHTSGKGPWQLVYLKPFVLKREALIEERRLKRLNRRSLLKLIGQ